MLRLIRQSVALLPTLSLMLLSACGDETTNGPVSGGSEVEIARAADVATAVALSAFPGAGASFRASLPVTATVPALTGEFGLTCPDVSFARGSGAGTLAVTLDYGAGCASELTGQWHSGRMDVDYTFTTYSIALAGFTARGYAFDGRMSGAHQGTGLTLNIDDLLLSGVSAYRVDGTLVGAWHDSDTPTRFEDDSWTVTGECVISEVEGPAWTLLISDPLVLSAGCPWPVGGRLTLQLASSPVQATVDFGTGTCDDVAILTTAGTSTTIHLGSGQEE